MKTTAPLPWFGTDGQVSKELGSLLDGVAHVTIPFAGGLAILPHLTARGIVANDTHEEAINFYRVASGFYKERLQCKLLERCLKTLSHPAEMKLARSILRESENRVDQAWAFWCLCWVGRKGKGGTKGQLTENSKPSIRWTAGGGNNASRLAAAASDLVEWTEQFRRCEFECNDFAVTLKKVADNPNCGIYCDPPWHGSEDQYLHPFTPADHTRLRDALLRFEHTRIVVRYGDCDEVRELYADGCEFRSVESRNQANGSVSEVWVIRNNVPS